MPEGPEVKLITYCLNNAITGKKLLEINIEKNKKTPKGYNEFVKSLPLKVKKVNKKGKFMYWDFGNNKYMFNHLMMTGSWSIKKDPYAALEFVFSGDLKLYYSDKRKFGRMEFIDSEEELTAELEKLGPDMMDSNINSAQFVKIMRKCNKKNIGVAMMSQDNVSGIGNYLRSEILYLAKISPHKKISELSDQQLIDIFLIGKNLLETSYTLKGCSLQDFKNLEGEDGSFQKNLQVYKRKKDAFGNVVKNDKIGGRSVFWVEKIQK